MAYIGRGTDNISNVEVLDNITFSGASSYTLQKGSANYVPISAANILVSIDGVVQANNFSVNGSTIDFGVAIANTSTCNFVLHFGTGLITTVQDGAVTTAKIGSSAITSAKMASNSIATASVIDDAITYAKMQDTSAANRVLGAASAGTVGEVQVATDMIADAQVDESKLKISNTPTNGYFLSAQSGNTGGLTWAEAGGGGILQVKTINKLDTQTISSSSFTAISSFTVSLTPSSSSSKILIFGTVCFGSGGNLYGQGSIYRQINSGGYSQLATAIGNADGNATRCTFPIQTVSTGDQTWKVFSNSFNFLDAPSTTNQVDYQIYCRSNGSTNIRINEEDNATDGDYDARPISTLTIMEIDSGVL